MNASLKFLTGERVGETVALSYQWGLTVGRDPRSSLPLRDDDALSRRHFEVCWDGANWVLADLGSTNGTTVNGESASSAILKSGDKIAAGGAVFRFETRAKGLLPIFRAADLENEDAVSERPDIPTLSNFPLGLDMGRDTRFFGLLDGARDFDFVVSCCRAGADVYTLFSGEQARELSAVGPCLVHLKQSGSFVRDWMQKAGENTGVLIASSADFETLGEHLREIFVVADEQDRQFFFRYYDPRVLNAFLPACNREELTEFFGPVELWVAEKGKHRLYTSYRIVNGELMAVSMPLADPRHQGSSPA